MDFRPETLSLIKDAELIAYNLRVLSGRFKLRAGESFDAGAWRNKYMVYNTVSNVLPELYKQVKHLVVGSKQPYWNMVNRVSSEWRHTGAYGKDWYAASVAYDRVLEIVYQAQDAEEAER